MIINDFIFIIIFCIILSIPFLLHLLLKFIVAKRFNFDCSKCRFGDCDFRDCQRWAGKRGIKK